jgi:two-component system, NtrC family, response regulator AtoC
VALVKEAKTANTSLPAATFPEEVIFGRSETMRGIRRKVAKLAGTTVPVLIEGESGTGKEVLARYIHSTSAVRQGPFVKVSCAAIPGALTESELFGYRKGAFTGANESKPGRIELANQGTLYLDEIAELDPTRQAKLLQVLQDGRFCRIGDQEDTCVDTRVICATNRNLEKEISSGGFRQDLYYRINVFHLFLPPLRDRLQDIPAIAEFILSQSMRRFDRPAPPIPLEAIRWMQTYQWPGNVRELENWIIRYVLLGSVDMRTTNEPARRLFEVPFEVGPDGSIPLKRITKRAILEAERAVILKTLEMHHWNRRRAAETLNVSYRSLIYKIRQAGLPRKRPAKRNAVSTTPNSVPNIPPKLAS